MASLDNGIGKVGLLTDINHIKQAEEILDVLQSQQIVTNIITVPGDIISLLDVSIWHNFSRVFINLPSDSFLSCGHIQGFFDLINLDYTGSSMLTAALANNRLNTKKIWQITGIATTNFLKWRPNINWEEIASLFGFPMAVKSLYAYNHKVFKVMNIEQLQYAIEKFFNLYDIIFEPWVTGDQYEVYIVGEKALHPVCVDETIVSADNIEPYVKRMQKLAIDALLAIGGQGGLAKVNIIMDVNRDCWVSSIDTNPLVGRDSTFSKAANLVDISFEVLLKNILMTSFTKKCHYKNLNFFSDFNKYFNKDEF